MVTASRAVVQRLLPLADLAEAVGEVVQRDGQVGEVGVGVGLGELAGGW